MHYSITGAEDYDVCVSPGRFIFLPVGTNLVYEALQDSTLLTIKIEELVGKLPECPTFRFQRTDDERDVHMDNKIHPLVINDRIELFVQSLIVSESDGLRCRCYGQLMAGQLMFLIQAYYPRQEYMQFYATVASSDVEFSDFVLKHWTDHMSVNELSEALSMTTQQFSMHFRRVFGESPGVWLQRRKSDRIYHDICSSHRSLKSIATEYGFSMANFIRYCRLNYGATPGTIRTQLARGEDITCTINPNPPKLRMR